MENERDNNYLSLHPRDKLLYNLKISGLVRHDNLLILKWRTETQVKGSLLMKILSSYLTQVAVILVLH